VERLEALLVTGTIGSGKTTVATEMCEVLAERRVSAAAIDLDWLAWTSLPPPGGYDALMATNLAALVPNFSAAGITHLVLIRALRERAQVETIRAALPRTNLRVVLLESPPALVEARLRARDHGDNLATHLAETEDFRRTEPGLADFTVANDERPARDVAEEVLEQVAWG
jgi:adenylylsulfate kinase